MPHGNTHFQQQWLQKEDKNGHVISKWLTDYNDCDFSAKCILCCSRLKYGNSGLSQILSHADGKKHKDLATRRFSGNQLHFTQGETPGSILFDKRSHNDQVTTAEVAWSMKVAMNNYSYNSCEDISSLFKFMFPGPVSSDFSMSRSKVSYLISDGLGRHFHNKLCEKLKNDDNPFSVQFDETGTVQNNKQCDVLVRTWCEEKGEVITRYLKSLMFGHAKGNDVAKGLLESVSEDGGLPLNRFLCIGSDGPNVNKTIWNNLNESLKEKGLPGLLDFKPCTIHIVHNAFKYGLQTYGQDAEQLTLDIFYWFRAHPCRKEDFFDTQMGLGLDEELFLRHVQCRWLTLLPALQRILKQWEPLKQYFLTDLPKKSQQERTGRVLQNNDSYQRICKALQGQDVLLQINFLVSVKVVFDRILTILQRQEPLIHLLHEECMVLVKTLLRRFLKPDACEKTSRDIIQMDLKKMDYQSDICELEVGEETRRVLRKLTPDQQKLP